MPFTTQDFLDDASQAACRRSSYSPGDDIAGEQSSVLSSKNKQDPVCRGYCRHVHCRTYRPVPRARLQVLPDIQSAPLATLGPATAFQIVLLHEKLADLQQSADIRTRLVGLAYADPKRYHLYSRTTQDYQASARQRNHAFESLLAEIKPSAAYFGHIDLPERHNFTAAIDDARLSYEEVCIEQLLDWHGRAEDLRLEARNDSEWFYESSAYVGCQEAVFKPGWSFENSRTEREGTHIVEEIAPEEVGHDPHAIEFLDLIPPECSSGSASAAQEIHVG